jgi:hypothetical protein
MITALKLLKEAAAKGWTFKVYGGGELDYKGPSASAAWEAVKATEEANVVFYSAAGEKLGVAFLMAPGPGSCEPEETLVDHTCSAEGKPKSEFELLCNKVTEEAL